jgi:hypothetical protein
MSNLPEHFAPKPPSTVNISGYGGTGANEAPRRIVGFVPRTHDEPLPQWVLNELHEAHKEGDEPTPWEADGNERYSRIVGICYPNQRHWAVEELVSGAWKDTRNMFQSEELARANARGLAYKNQVPYRVKEVIWRG